MLSGCAAKPDFETSVKFNKEIELNDLYLYSFIDLHEKIIGENIVPELKQQFELQFEQRGININQLWYKDSQLLTNTAISEVDGETTVPVEKIVLANLENEQNVNAKYRLIAFPVYVNHGKSSAGYRVKWSLSGVATNEVIWAASSWTYNVDMFSNDERPEKRAKLLVKGLLRQLQNAGAVKKR